MQSYIITTDSAADMNKDYYGSNNIPVISFKYSIDDVDYIDDPGNNELCEEFYKKLDNGKLPTTSQINFQEFYEFFEPILKEGNDILHLCFSSGLTGTFNNAVTAANELMEAYPERTIKIIDSLCASAGLGLLLDDLVDKKLQGYSLSDLYNHANEIKLNIHHWFYPTNLNQLIRGGRVSKLSGTVGNLLNICPLLNIDTDGKIANIAKVRGRKKTAAEVIAKMEHYAKDGLNYNGKCFISHSCCKEDADYLLEELTKKFPQLKGNIKVSHIGPIIGTHTGRGTVSLFFFGEKRV